MGNLKKSLAWYTLLVYDLEFTTPCWSATSSLLHLNQFRGGGGEAPLAPPQYANVSHSINYYSSQAAQLQWIESMSLKQN